MRIINMKKMTKIVCTLGPACNTEKTLTEMFEAGMDIARLNMGHGTHATHKAILDELKNLRKKGLQVLVDTKGPEMRIGTFKNGQVILVPEQKFTFTTNDIVGDATKVSLKYKQLVKEVKPKDRIFANNGMLVLEVKKVTKTDVECVVLFGGKLSNNKGLNVPNLVPSSPFLSDADKLDLLFAIQNKADWVALSFVSNEQDVKDARAFLNENGGENIKIISKIENASGVLNASKILDESDGLMVARGDLGVEIPLEKLPPIQKKLISLCNVKRKECIVATEMLESMTNSTRPTRAEVNDVANAIYEEATATMLSGETSVGINPVLVVQTMSKIINEIEKYVYVTKQSLKN